MFKSGRYWDCIRLCIYLEAATTMLANTRCIASKPRYEQYLRIRISRKMFQKYELQWVDGHVLEALRKIMR